MPSIDLGQVVGPTGATGPQGPQGIQGNPGPNQITSATATTFNGVLAGSNGVVGVRAVDSTPDSLHTANLITSAAVADAITGVESDLASIHATGSNNATGAIIPAGTYFYLDGVLVRAKTDIASGAAFTSGTNYEAVTAGGLNDLKSAFQATPVSVTLNSERIDVNSSDVMVLEFGDFAFVFGTIKITDNFGSNTVIGSNFPTPAIGSVWVTLVGATTFDQYMTRVINAPGSPLNRSWLAVENLNKSTDEYYYISAVYPTA